MSFLVSNNFDEHAFISFSVELVVEDLLPGSKIQVIVRDGDNGLSTNERPL